MKNSKRFIIITELTACLVLLVAPGAMSFCKGCNAYIICSTYCSTVESGSLITEKTFGRRAIDGTGKDCNTFGCACKRCVPDMSFNEMLSWCASAYEKEFKELRGRACSRFGEINCRWKVHIEYFNSNTYSPQKYHKCNP